MIPKTINVMGVKYKVTSRVADGFHGMCDTRKCELTIHKDDDKQRQEKTLIHEIVHAMFFETGLHEINDEKHVTILENTIYHLLKNNDFTWLRKN